MLDVEVEFGPAVKGLEQLAKDIRDAESKATREVAKTLIIPAMKQAVSHAGGPAPIGRLGARTGRLRAQVKARYWRDRDGMTNGAVKVIGDRAHIARFHEAGTKSHGRYGGPLPARKMFETVGRTIRTAIEQAHVAAFERHMKAKGYR